METLEEVLMDETLFEKSEVFAGSGGPDLPYYGFSERQFRKMRIEGLESLTLGLGSCLRLIRLVLNGLLHAVGNLVEVGVVDVLEVCVHLGHVGAQLGTRVHHLGEVGLARQNVLVLLPTIVNFPALVFQNGMTLKYVQLLVTYMRISLKRDRPSANS